MHLNDPHSLGRAAEQLLITSIHVTVHMFRSQHGRCSLGRFATSPFTLMCVVA